MNPKLPIHPSPSVLYAHNSVFFLRMRLSVKEERTANF